MLSLNIKDIQQQLIINSEREWHNGLLRKYPVRLRMHGMLVYLLPTRETLWADDVLLIFLVHNIIMEV